MLFPNSMQNQTSKEGKTAYNQSNLHCYKETLVNWLMDEKSMCLQILPPTVQISSIWRSGNRGKHLTRPRQKGLVISIEIGLSE